MTWATGIDTSIILSLYLFPLLIPFILSLDVYKRQLYAQNSHYLVELKDCLVQDPVIQAIANDLADLLTYYQIPIADERKELGVRTMMIRRARKSGQVQIIVVTSRQININNLVQDLVTQHPEIVTVAVNKNTSRSCLLYTSHQKSLEKV